MSPTTKALVLNVLIESLNDQIRGLASAIAEADIRAAGLCQSDDDWMISKYALLPMREDLAKLKTMLAEFTAPGR